MDPDEDVDYDSLVMPGAPIFGDSLGPNFPGYQLATDLDFGENENFDITDNSYPAFTGQAPLFRAEETGRICGYRNPETGELDCLELETAVNRFRDGQCAGHAVTDTEEDDLEYPASSRIWERKYFPPADPNTATMQALSDEIKDRIPQQLADLVNQAEADAGSDLSVVEFSTLVPREVSPALESMITTDGIWRPQVLGRIAGRTAALVGTDGGELLPVSSASDIVQFLSTRLTPIAFARLDTVTTNDGRILYAYKNGGAVSGVFDLRESPRELNITFGEQQALTRSQTARARFNRAQRIVDAQPYPRDMNVRGAGGHHLRPRAKGFGSEHVLMGGVNLFNHIGNKFSKSRERVVKPPHSSWSAGGAGGSSFVQKWLQRGGYGYHSADAIKRRRAQAKLAAGLGNPPLMGGFLGLPKRKDVVAASNAANAEAHRRRVLGGARRGSYKGLPFYKFGA